MSTGGIAYNESITPRTCQAVDFVHMVEALMLVCGESTVMRPELVEKYYLVQDTYLSHSCNSLSLSAHSGGKLLSLATGRSLSCCLSLVGCRSLSLVSLLSHCVRASLVSSRSPGPSLCLVVVLLSCWSLSWQQVSIPLFGCRSLSLSSCCCLVVSLEPLLSATGLSLSRVTLLAAGLSHVSRLISLSRMWQVSLRVSLLDVHKQQPNLYRVKSD